MHSGRSDALANSAPIDSPDMSRQGMVIALQYGEGLPAFDSIADAKRSLFALRDQILHAFLTQHGQELTLDFSPSSLKVLERWFLEGRSTASESAFIHLAIGFYFGEVLCRGAGFEWVVAEFAFQAGRYEVGVSQGRFSLMLSTGLHPRLAPNNKRMQSLFRRYKSYVPSGPTDGIRNANLDGKPN
jgi:hypothetical protein